MDDRKDFKRGNIKRFLDYQFAFLNFYKGVEARYCLEINVTSCSADVIEKCEKVKRIPFLCFKISQHLLERKVLYVYFICEKVKWNTIFTCFDFAEVTEDGGFRFEPSTTRYEFIDIKTKIMNFFKVED